MSEIERKTGKIVNTGLSPDEWMEKNQVPKKDIEDLGWDDLSMYLHDRNKGIVAGGVVWEFERVTDVGMDYHEAYTLRPGGDRVEFDVTYHNGCTHYTELVGNYLNKLKEDKAI